MRWLLLLLALLLCGCPSTEPPPVLGTLARFELTDQNGRPVSRKSLEGRVWVASFAFTRCPTVCPRIMRRIRRLQDLSKSKDIELYFATFSVDPEFDTPEVLKAFGKRYGADFRSWSLLTGDSSTVKTTVTESFKLGLEGSIDPEKEHMGITHGSHLVLVDQKARIRGYYRVSEEAEMQRLLLDGASLL